VGGPRSGEHAHESAGARADIRHAAPRDITIGQQRVEEVVEQRGGAEKSAGAGIQGPLFAKIGDGSRPELIRHHFVPEAGARMSRSSSFEYSGPAR